MNYIDHIGFSVTIGAIFIVFITLYKLYRISKLAKPKKESIFIIWLLGLLTFLSGVLNQIFNIRNTLEAIESSGEINATILSSGLNDSYKTTVSGLIVFMLSLILWGIVKTIQDRKGYETETSSNANTNHNG